MMPADKPPLRRGQIWWITWEHSRGSEQRGRRPAVIVQTNSFNRSQRYTNTIAVALSTAEHDVPVHVTVEPAEQNGLSKRSYVMCEHLVTVSRERLDGLIGELNSETMARVDTALKLILSLR